MLIQKLPYLAPKLQPFNPHLLLSPPPPPTLTSLLRRHALIITSGSSANPFLASKLISLFSSSFRPDISSLIFFTSVPSRSRDAFLWNSVIKSHFSNSGFALALWLFRRMLGSGSCPDSFTIPMAASACAELTCIVPGKSIHSYCTKAGISDVGSCLVYMYAKCGVLEDALKVFGEMSRKDLVAWTAVLIGCVSNGKEGLGLFCFREMCRAGVVPGYRALEGALQACASLGAVKEGWCLHGFSVRVGVEDFCSVKSMILSMYSKCERLEEACRTFRELEERDVVSWTSIVGVYARKGLIDESLRLFQEMMGSGIEPDGVLHSCLLLAFANGNDVRGAKAFHGIILRGNLGLKKMVFNSLLSTYCKIELLEDAEKVFNMTKSRDPEPWNLMVSEYAKKGEDAKSFDLFREMHSIGLGMDSGINSLNSVVSSCSQLGELLLGQSVHCYMIKNQIHSDPSIANSLITMYGKCERPDLARRIFDQMPRDVITWNALISAYTHAGYSDDALSLFDQMLLEKVKPNSTTLLIALSACSHMAALHKGKSIHKYIKESKLDVDESLYTALIDMYSKCGKLDASREIFDSMPQKDVVSYNVMVSGYGAHGNAKEALQIFEEMEKQCNVNPNEVTFLALLSTCCHQGLLDEGKNLFHKMRSYYKIKPTQKHYACMVDLFARSGKLYEAEKLIHTMPMEPDGGIWGSLLGACHKYNNVEMGEKVANKVLEIDPENDGYYVLMSNMYGCYGKWKEVESLRGVMRSRGVRKRVGWSSVELEGKIHVFVVGENFDKQGEKMNLMLQGLGRQMEEQNWL